MKTEKVSVNLNPTELGQIDLLVEKGIFDNRSDFMRSAARKSLENYTDDFQRFLKPAHLQDEPEHGKHNQWAFGILHLHKEEFTRRIKKGKKFHIRVIGLLSIAKDVTVDDIQQTVLTCKVSGKLMAAPEVKAALEALNR
ncbi:MAG: hypothetical protein FWC71_06770 [Defluviitaleaceae bacterium]|nr:hypothetical protein [Defluviitaleaceae bacterium]